MKLVQTIKSIPEIKIEPKDHSGSFDSGTFRKSMKRVGPIKVQMGWNADDFVRNLITVVFTANVVRIPRFMNPVRGRRRGKNKIVS